MLCSIPQKLHPIAESALEGWLCGLLPDALLPYYATLVASDNLSWATCLVETTFLIGG